MAAEKRIGLIQGLGPGEVGRKALESRTGGQGALPKDQALQGGSRGLREPEGLEEVGPPVPQSGQGQRLPRGQALFQGALPLPVPYLAGQPLVGDDRQGLGMGLFEQVIL